MSVLGIVKPDPIGRILDTGYAKFQSPKGVCGLFRQDGEILRLLAVASIEEGCGFFKDFIEACKEEFKEVVVEAIMNDEIRPMLIRYGFTNDGDESMKWRKSE